ncbi:DUF6177 family protein [Kribbella karoonensis]|uniref:Uncharacterized protein n=1 Tax=Kribbella karoonensis TaxID=324851 RepID=A0ABN2DPV5_9ACTN
MTSELDFLPAVDTYTDKVLVVEQHRPVIGLSTWLLDAAIAAERSDRELQLVTSSGSRVTEAVRTQLLASGTRWVVESSNGYYDGLSGIELAWDGASFMPVGGKEAPRLTRDWLTRPENVTTTLQVVTRVRYPAVESTVVGLATEFLIERLAGGPPAGWGTEEPVSRPWDARALTSFCRRWVPHGTLITVTGPYPTGDCRPTTGVLEVDVCQGGIEETTTIAIGRQGSRAPDPDNLLPVLRDFTERFEVVSAVFLAAGTAPDTCTLPRYTGFPRPVGLVLGAEGRAALGPEAAPAIESGSAVSIGDDTCLWFPVGTGHTPRDWVTFAGLFRRIAAATAKHGGQEAVPAVKFRMPD